MRYRINEYIIIRNILTTGCMTTTSTMEIVKVNSLDEKNQTYSLRSCNGSYFPKSEKVLKGNSYRLDLNPDFLVRLADRETKIEGQKTDELYLLYDFSVGNHTHIVVHVYVEGSAVFYYPCGFDVVDSRIRINTFEEFHLAVVENQNIEMQFEVEAISKAYGEIEDPLVGLLSRLFDSSTCYGQCKQQEVSNTDLSKAKELADKTDAAKERFLSVCRAIEFEYRSTPEKSPILQDLFEKMNIAHQGHFGETAL